jgi:hypothetical protein
MTLYALRPDPVTGSLDDAEVISESRYGWQFTGVEDAIVAAEIVDNHWRVPADRLEELVQQVPAMDLRTQRSLADKIHALGEVMINAGSIRSFLSDAVNAGCVVVLG